MLDLSSSRSDHLIVSPKRCAGRVCRSVHLKSPSLAEANQDFAEASHLFARRSDSCSFLPKRRAVVSHRSVDAFAEAIHPDSGRSDRCSILPKRRLSGVPESDPILAETMLRWIFPEAMMPSAETNRRMARSDALDCPKRSLGCAEAIISKPARPLLPKQFITPKRPRWPRSYLQKLLQRCPKQHGLGCRKRPGFTDVLRSGKLRSCRSEQTSNRSDGSQLHPEQPIRRRNDAYRTFDPKRAIPDRCRSEKADQTPKRRIPKGFPKRANHRSVSAGCRSESLHIPERISHPHSEANVRSQYAEANCRSVAHYVIPERASLSMIASGAAGEPGIPNT